MCTVKLKHKDKCVRYRFFVVPGDVPVPRTMWNARHRFAKHTDNNI